MEDETSSPNMEWKKTGFESTEKLTLKTNLKKALEHEAKDKTGVQTAFRATPSELPKGLNKIRKKIKDVYDDEEDENDFLIAPLEANSLLNALHDNEKKQLKSQETIKNIKMQQDAGKMEALLMANQLTRQVGLKDLNKNTINKNFQNIAVGSETFENALKDDVSKKMKIKGKAIAKKDLVSLLRGIKRVKSMTPEDNINGKNRTLEGWKLEDLINAGDKNTKDQEVAEMILKKSGRKSAKKEVEENKKGNNKLKSQKVELTASKNLFRD